MVTKGNTYFPFPTVWMWTSLKVSQPVLLTRTLSKHGDLTMQAKWRSSERALMELRVQKW